MACPHSGSTYSTRPVCICIFSYQGTMVGSLRLDGYSEQQKLHAVACLENYRMELEIQGKKSVKLKEEEHGN